MSKEELPAHPMCLSEIDFLNERARLVFVQAKEHSSKILECAQKLTRQYLSKCAFDPARICLAAVGSVGRFEALEASDLDLIPILQDDAALASYQPLDSDLRSMLSEGLHIKVSEGKDLTSCTSITKLVDPETIGGDKDDSQSLTKRVLVLTESQSAGGELLLEDVRNRILKGYSGAERTRGRHVLSFCNDIARYYRTLCVEYKAKVDNQNKDWSTRNLKLRHSRKLWYFATILSIAAVAVRHPQGSEAGYVKELLNAFGVPPYIRLLRAVPEIDTKIQAERILNCSAFFMAYMQGADRREALAKIDHKNRYRMALDNPFPTLKLNSEVMHESMSRLIENLPGATRQRIFDWFLL